MDRPDHVEPHEDKPPVIVQPRPVADQLLLMFGKIAGLALLLCVVLTALLAIFRPEADLTAMARLLDTQLSIILGAVLGYAAHPPERTT